MHSRYNEKCIYGKVTTRVTVQNNNNNNNSNNINNNYTYTTPLASTLSKVVYFIAEYERKNNDVIMRLTSPDLHRTRNYTRCIAIRCRAVFVRCPAVVFSTHVITSITCIETKVRFCSLLCLFCRYSGYRCINRGHDIGCRVPPLT